jgi:hypothetical protein
MAFCNVCLRVLMQRAGRAHVIGDYGHTLPDRDPMEVALDSDLRIRGHSVSQQPLASVCPGNMRVLV